MTALDWIFFVPLAAFAVGTLAALAFNFWHHGFYG